MVKSFKLKQVYLKRNYTHIGSYAKRRKNTQTIRIYDFGLEITHITKHFLTSGNDPRSFYETIKHLPRFYFKSAPPMSKTQ